jgi:hypothetical protein
MAVKPTWTARYGNARTVFRFVHRHACPVFMRLALPRDLESPEGDIFRAVVAETVSLVDRSLW